MNPLFTQTWNLFSPNPINTNITILIQFKGAGIGKVDTTVWYDIMRPMIKAKQQSFWSPAQRILKNMSSLTQSISQADNDIKEYVQKQDTVKDKGKLFRQMYSRIFPTVPGHKVLVQYSAYVFKNAYPQKSIDSIFVRYRIVYQEFPRFSKRHLNYFDKKKWKYSEYKSNFYRLE